MPLTSRHLAFMVSQFTLICAIAFWLLPLPFAQRASSAQASALTGETTTFTGTATVSETVIFTDYEQITTPFHYQSATWLQDKRILLISSGQTAAIYDPALDVISPTGNMNFAHYGKQATLLADGNVLITGSSSCYWEDNSPYYQNTFHCNNHTAELFLTSQGIFTPTGTMITPRVEGYTTTLLPDGRVLLAGGKWPCIVDAMYTGSACYATAAAELYDPTTGTFIETDPVDWRGWHSATLLQDGTVLIAGGWAVQNRFESPIYNTSAGIYDPASDSYSRVGSLRQARMSHSAALLLNGKVLVLGGEVSEPPYWDPLYRPELYDPATDAFTSLPVLPEDVYYSLPVALPNGQLLVFRDGGADLFNPLTNTFRRAGNLAQSGLREATLLDDGSVLLLGDTASGLWTARGLLTSVSVFTGALTLPSGWVNSTTVTVSFSGSSSTTPLEAGSATRSTPSLPSEWIPLTDRETVTATYTFNQDGIVPLWLRLRDIHQRTAIVVTGTVQIDTAAPRASMQALPPTIGSTEISLEWSGADTRSGVAGYDVEVREGTAGAWSRILTATTALSTTFTGEHGTTYYFRARAHDIAGNVEAWPNSYDTYTLVDTAAPTGSVTINAGAHATTVREVVLYLPASDAHNSVNQMRLSTDGTTWGQWQARSTPFTYTLPQGDGLQTVYAQYRDVAGNISAAVSDTIRLDEAAGTDELVTINDGALWTNSTSVTLTISAPARTSNMRLSNDGGFANAGWQLFESRPDWELIPYGSYAIPRTVYVRVRNMDGTESTVYSDEIIYDPVPPAGTLSIQSVTSTSVNVKLNANDPDNLSGVAAMRVALTSNLSQVAWQPYASSRTLPRNGTTPENVRAYAQFRDGAGNVSSVVCAAASGSCPAGGSTVTATATRTPTRTPTRTITVTATRTPTRTPTRTVTATGTAVATGTRTPTATASVAASTTRTTTATAVATVTGTRTATVTALPSGTATRTTTATRTPTVSVTVAPDAYELYLPIVVHRR